MSTISPLFSWRSVIIDSDLPATAKLVALCLSMHMSERGDSCFPSITTQCQETGLSRSTVCGHLKLLEEGAFLRRETGTKGHSTRYVATFPISFTAGQVGSAMSELSSSVVAPEVVKDHDKEKDLAKPSAPRARNPVWDALERVTQFKPETRNEQADFGKTVSQLRAVMPSDVTESEAFVAMDIRRQEWRRRYDSAAFTHRVLRDHWGELASADVRRGPALPELPEGDTF